MGEVTMMEVITRAIVPPVAQAGMMVSSVSIAPTPTSYSNGEITVRKVPSRRQDVIPASGLTTDLKPYGSPNACSARWPATSSVIGPTGSLAWCILHYPTHRPDHSGPAPRD